MLLSKLHCFSYFIKDLEISTLSSAFIYKQNKNNANFMIQEITVDNITCVKFEKKKQYWKFRISGF